MIVAVPLSLVSLSLDQLQPSDQCHHVCGDVIDHILLISCFKALVAVTREQALIFDVVDNRHSRDAQRALLHVGVVLAGLIIVSVANLNLKHGNDRAKQVLHESFLLADQQRPSLQLGQCVATLALARDQDKGVTSVRAYK